MYTRSLACSVLIVACTFVSACGSKHPPKSPEPIAAPSNAGVENTPVPEPSPPKSLYDRVGGKDAITKIVDSFMKNLAGNEITKKRFARLSKARTEKFREHFTEQLCQETGGDCTYTGKDMKSAHKGLRITDAEWDAFIWAFKAAMEENSVGEVERADLYALLAPMKDKIVEVKPKGKTVQSLP
ncbi:MAG: group 1 truncated hemoglobin [Polyangiaceae bacterium]|nr:group 1 truncated hemoglobin [Polyangiaceae bacterium]